MSNSRGEDLLERLSERGRAVEAAAAERVRSSADSFRERLGGLVQALHELLESSVGTMLEETRQPNSDQVAELRRRIAAVEEAVQQMLAETVSGDEPVYHVIPHPAGGWKVEAELARRPWSTHNTKSAALTAGRELARSNQPSRLVIHRADGTIQQHHSYPNS